MSEGRRNACVVPRVTPEDHLFLRRAWWAAVAVGARTDTDVLVAGKDPFDSSRGFNQARVLGGDDPREALGVYARVLGPRPPGRFLALADLGDARMLILYVEDTEQERWTSEGVHTCGDLDRVASLGPLEREQHERRVALFQVVRRVVEGEIRRHSHRPHLAKDFAALICDVNPRRSTRDDVGRDVIGQSPST